ncbi:MAG: hypothetical protein QM679_03450 [Patulibacter sp.]
MLREQQRSGHRQAVVDSEAPSLKQSGRVRRLKRSGIAVEKVAVDVADPQLRALGLE